ncbi:MAG: hypothetical protein QOE05_1252 [Actinomycetota bacterium]|nr:hypothetical protein [Actinomycetota bacterium]
MSKTNLVLGSVLLLLAACGTEPAPSAAGPLGKPGDKGTLCVPADAAGRATDGFNALHNKDTRAVTISAVELAASRNLQVTAAYIVPVANSTLLGVFGGVYPNPQTPPQPGWERRVPAVGASVPQAGQGPDSNLVLEMKLVDSAVAGSAAGLRLRYRVEGKSFRWSSPVAIRIVPHTAQCA